MPESDVQLALIADVAPLVVAKEPFITFELPGEPHAWERAGATIRWSNGRPFVHFYVPAAEQQYREQIQWCAKSVMRSKEPTAKPIALLIHAFMGIPKSWPWKKQQAARAGMILPTGKPDADNFLKIVGDALKGLVWIDDALVCDGRALKKYSDRPALRCEVREYVPPK